MGLTISSTAFVPALYESCYPSKELRIKKKFIKIIIPIIWRSMYIIVSIKDKRKIKINDTTKHKVQRKRKD